MAAGSEASAVKAGLPVLLFPEPEDFARWVSAADADTMGA